MNSGKNTEWSRYRTVRRYRHLYNEHIYIYIQHIHIYIYIYIYEYISIYKWLVSVALVISSRTVAPLRFGILHVASQIFCHTITLVSSWAFASSNLLVVWRPHKHSNWLTKSVRFRQRFVFCGRPTEAKWRRGNSMILIPIPPWWKFCCSMPLPLLLLPPPSSLFLTQP